MDEPGSGPRAGVSERAAAFVGMREREMNLTVTIIRSSGGWDALERDISEPLDDAVEASTRAAIAGAVESGTIDPDEDFLAEDVEAELSVVLADDGFVQGLNRQFRNQDKPTNVLSFPAASFEAGEAEGEPMPLGDVIIAYETLLREAEAEGKAPLDHLRHLVVHGTLHLLGFDHDDDDEAECMEAVERLALASLGVADPYLADQHDETAKQAGATGQTSSRGIIR
jgi:probable rRNA maturation factor